jgi:hypothetical protein
VKTGRYKKPIAKFTTTHLWNGQVQKNQLKNLLQPICAYGQA